VPKLEAPYTKSWGRLCPVLNARARYGSGCSTRLQAAGLRTISKQRERLHLKLIEAEEQLADRPPTAVGQSALHRVGRPVVQHMAALEKAPQVGKPLLARLLFRCATASTTRVRRTFIAPIRSGQRAGRPRQSRQVPPSHRPSGHRAGCGPESGVGGGIAGSVRRHGRTGRCGSVQASPSDTAGGTQDGPASRYAATLPSTR
jgi:hypothetical protein